MPKLKIGRILIQAAKIIATLSILLASIIYLMPLLNIDLGKIQIPTFDTPIRKETLKIETNDQDQTFKCNFNWTEQDGSRTDKEQSICYLRIQQTEEGTQAMFNYGEYLVDGWPIFPVSNTNNTYILESSKRSLVERVRIVVDIKDDKISGTVTNITPDISTFVEGSFSGESIPFEEYKAKVLD